MVELVRHAVRVLAARRRERRKRERRSPHWRAAERRHLAAHPACSSCGGRIELQVHHIEPFHLRPDLELEPSNLLTLCMGPLECHLRIGHGGDFGHYDPEVRADAAEAVHHRLTAERDARHHRLPIREAE